MEMFDRLKEICDQLHGPDGCSWDKEQTFASSRPHLLEND